jgi:hypothetical protein
VPDGPGQQDAIPLPRLLGRCPDHLLCCAPDRLEPQMLSAVQSAKVKASALVFADAQGRELARLARRTGE